MGGKMSRRKGYSGEYEVRDYFRSLGYRADRVPSSGAAEGFKGDIKVIDSANLEEMLVEVKRYASSFKRLYAALNAADKHPISMYLGDKTAYLAYDFKDLPVFPWNSGRVHMFKASKPLRKVATMHKLVKECKILVVRDDHKPWIYLYYL